MPYAIRNVLFYFFLLFLLRVLLRNQWAAAVAFAGVFALLSALGNDDRPWIGGLMGFLYFGTGAFVVLGWGLVSFAVGIFVSALLMNVPATLDASAWYFGNMMLLIAIAVGLSSWGSYTSLAGRPAAFDEIVTNFGEASFTFSRRLAFPFCLSSTPVFGLLGS